MIKAIKSIKRFWSERTGTAMVEFGIIINVYIGLIFATILWGIWLWEYNTLQHATMQAARCSILPTPGGGKLCGTVNSYGTINTFAVGPASAVTAGSGFTAASAGSGVYQCVTANYNSGFTTFTSQLFYFLDNRLSPRICYTTP